MESQGFVLKALLLEEPNIKGDIHYLLMRKSWEAIAYIDSVAPDAVLKEAVPDEYIFGLDNLKISLSGFQGDVSRKEQQFNYYIESKSVRIFKDTKALNLIWQIIYLDNDYLVLDIDGLRLFLIHP